MKNKIITVFIASLILFTIASASVYAESFARPNDGQTTESMISDKQAFDRQIKTSSIGKENMHEKKTYQEEPIQNDESVMDDEVAEPSVFSSEEYPKELDWIYDDIGAYDKKNVTKFKYDGHSTVYSFLNVDIYNESKANESELGDIKVRFVEFEYDYGDDEYDYRTLHVEKAADNYSVWFLFDSDDLVEGNEYGIIVENKSYYKYSVEGDIKEYRDLSTEAKVNDDSPIKVKARSKYYFYPLKSSDITCLPYISSVKSSNTKVAVGYCYGHKLALYAKKYGKCTLTIRLRTGTVIKTKVTVQNGNPKLKKKHINMLTKQKRTNKVLFTNKKVKWSSTNKKVATVNSKGVIRAKSVGVCHIKARVAGKTLRCRVEVGRPDFYSELISYSTDSNTFYVEIENYGDKNLTIYAKDAIAKDKDYKSLDRKLRFKHWSRTVTVKPLQKKKIPFIVIGSPTWYRVEDFDVYFYFKFDGKKRKCWVNNGDCGGYRSGNKWLYTFIGWED